MANRAIWGKVQLIFNQVSDYTKWEKVCWLILEFKKSHDKKYKHYFPGTG